MNEENYARFVNLIENDYELLYLREVKKNNDATIKKLEEDVKKKEEDEKQNKATIKKLEEDVKKKEEDEKQNKATIKKLKEELKKFMQMKDNRESNENEINKKQKLND